MQGAPCPGAQENLDSFMAAFYPEGGVMMQACQAAASLVSHCQCNVLKPQTKHTPIMLDVGVCSAACAHAHSASKRPVLSLGAAIPQGG